MSAKFHTVHPATGELLRDLPTAADEDEAVALASDSSFGLGGSVISADIVKVQRVADRIDTGMVWINQATWTEPDLPFGGAKRSGTGRELGAKGIQEFVNKKLIRTP